MKKKPVIQLLLKSRNKMFFKKYILN